MFKLFKSKKPPLDKIETVIGSNTSFNGHLKCDGNIRIDGVCEGGVIETVGNVVVAPQGRVAAKIIAEHVSVAGEVTGAIYARGRLEILSTGQVMGEVRVANFYKDEAGILGGTLLMGEDAATAGDAVEVPPRPEEPA
ncbi:MAG: polymer-forming cytoskeletal protein [Anaerolineae bacterium]